MELLFAFQEWPYAETFRISRSAKTNSELFTVYIRDGAHVGRGECGLLPQYGQTREDVAPALADAADLLGAGATRADIAAKVSNTSARNALDCALWDLECKRSGQDVWQRSGVPRKDRIEVDLTIGINPTPKMREVPPPRRKRGTDNYQLGVTEMLQAALKNSTAQYRKLATLLPTTAGINAIVRTQQMGARVPEVGGELLNLLLLALLYGALAAWRLRVPARPPA